MRGPGGARLPGRRAPARGRPRAGRLHHRRARASATSTSHVDPRVLDPASGDRAPRRGGARAAAQGARVVDVGTGSGAVALALKDERPDLDVVGDRRQRGRAGRRARQRRAARARRRASSRADLLDGVAGELDAVVSNPPYVEDGARRWRPRSCATSPRGALFAGPDGLDGRAPAGGPGRRARRRFLAARGRRRPGAGGRGARARGRLRARRAPARPRRHRARGGRAALIDAADARTFERCIAVGGVAVFPADTVYGLACEPDSKEAVAAPVRAQGPPRPTSRRRSCSSRSSSRWPRCPSSGRARARALRRAAARRGDAAAAQPGGAASRWPAGRIRRRSGCACRPGRRRSRRSRAVRWPVLQSSANAAGGADARRLADVPERIRARADLVLDGGELPGTPSTVVDLRAYERDGALDGRARGRGRVRRGVAAAARVRAVTTAAVRHRWLGLHRWRARPAARRPTAGPCARSRAATRSADVVRERGAEPVRGDLADAALDGGGRRRLRGRLPRSRRASATGVAREDFERGNVQGTRNALAAARQAGVRRFVHVGTEAALLARRAAGRGRRATPLRVSPPAHAAYAGATNGPASAGSTCARVARERSRSTRRRHAVAAARRSQRADGAASSGRAARGGGRMALAPTASAADRGRAATLATADAGAARLPVARRRSGGGGRGGRDARGAPSASGTPPARDRSDDGMDSAAHGSRRTLVRRRGGVATGAVRWNRPPGSDAPSIRRSAWAPHR